MIEFKYLRDNLEYIIIIVWKDEFMENDNIKMVEDLCDVPVIAKVYQNDKNLRLDVDTEELISYFK